MVGIYDLWQKVLQIGVGSRLTRDDIASKFLSHPVIFEFRKLDHAVVRGLEDAFSSVDGVSDEKFKLYDCIFCVMEKP